MNEKRLIEIETRLAHQEHLLASLDDALVKQQAQLTRLEELCAALLQRIRSLPEPAEAPAAGDERPPHY